jgi:hypothetical protein
MTAARWRAETIVSHEINKSGPCITPSRSEQMIASLINLLIVLLIVGVIWWAINAVLALIPLPAPIGQIVRIILILILCLIVIYALMGFLPGGHGEMRLLR